LRDLRSLPKAHLHLHLDGAMRYDTLVEELVNRGADPPLIPSGSTYSSFSAFMATITACHEVLRTPAGVSRVLREVVEDAATDGAIWIEVSVWPGLFDGRLGNEQDVIEMLLEFGHSAARTFGIGFGLMVSANRHQGPATALATARQAVAFVDAGVVSFGLDGDEAAFPPAPFEDAFLVASEAGLLSTPHAGELLGPRSVVDAINLLKADRIGHGVPAVESPELVHRLAESGVCLDVCPTSNAKLDVFDFEHHPLPTLVGAGVNCSINADDPLLFGSGLRDEYELCRTMFGLSDQELATIARTSIEKSGAPPAIKASGFSGVDTWLGAGVDSARALP
jgi:adenosine deaminase